jgi:hypothetical protein
MVRRAMHHATIWASAGIEFAQWLNDRVGERTWLADKPPPAMRIALIGRSTATF